jgi:hypothetical protein
MVACDLSAQAFSLEKNWIFLSSSPVVSTSFTYRYVNGWNLFSHELCLVEKCS